MTTTMILLVAAVLLLAWFIYNQKVKFGTATEEQNYSAAKTYNNYTVRYL